MSIFRFRAVRWFLTLGLFLPAGGVSSADFIVAPGPNANTEGSQGQNFPFNPRGTSGVTTQRYQQVYAASEFASAGDSLLITQIAFRPDARIFGIPRDFGHPFSTTIGDISISLSTTTQAVDGLSLTFSENIGSDEKVVRTGPLTLSSADTGPDDGPKDFDILIDLSTPFFYRPALGNLLLDVRNISGELTTAFDAESTVGDGTSRVGTFRAGNADSPVGDFRDSVGIITRFQVQVVPEPSTLSLAGLGGLIGLGAALRRRRRRVSPRSPVVQGASD